MDAMLDFGSQKAATDATGNPAGSRATHASSSSLVNGPVRKSIEPGLNPPNRPLHGAGVVGAGSSHSLLGPNYESPFPHDLQRGAPALSGSSFDDGMGLSSGSLTGKYNPIYARFHGTPLLPSSAAERRPSMGGFAPFADTGSMLQDEDADIYSPPRTGSNDRRFSCLMGLGESLTEELEREERRKARGIWRSKADLWGKLLMPNRKKALNDPTFYDSEDSDYVPSPRISDETALDRMLAIDRTVKGLKSTESPQLKREMMQIGYSSKRWAKVLIKAHKTSRKPAPSTPAPRDLPTSRPRKPTARRDSIYYQPTTQAPRPYIKKQDDMYTPQPPKRESKPLDTHYVVDADGTLRCIGCNKGGYRSTLGVRSHLSHCPAKQAERKAQGSVKMEDLPAPQPDLVNRDTRMPAQPRRTPTAQHAEDPSLSASSHMPSIPLGLPLVANTFSHGSALVSRRVSFRVTEDAAWEEARLQSYDDRSNSHQVALRDGRVLWAVLTTHNCCLAPQQEGRKPSAASMQRLDVAFGSSSAAAPVPVRKALMTGDGDMSSTEGDDTRSISSGTRRSSRRAIGSTSGDAEVEKALGRNQFWRQYEEQLPKSGGKRKASYPTTSMDKALQSSDDEENESGPRRKMRMTGASNAASEEQQQLQHALMDGAYSMGSGFHQAGSYFPCRECTAVFRSKQHLGWHTRRNECPGSEAYETPTPPMLPSAPQEQQPVMPAPTTNEGMASFMEVERSAFAPQKRGAEAITEDMGEEEEEAVNRKKPRRG